MFSTHAKHLRKFFSGRKISKQHNEIERKNIYIYLLTQVSKIQVFKPPKVAVNTSSYSLQPEIWPCLGDPWGEEYHKGQGLQVIQP